MKKSILKLKTNNIFGIVRQIGSAHAQGILYLTEKLHGRLVQTTRKLSIMSNLSVKSCGKVAVWSTTSSMCARWNRINGIVI